MFSKLSFVRLFFFFVVSFGGKFGFKGDVVVIVYVFYFWEEFIFFFCGWKFFSFYLVIKGDL